MAYPSIKASAKGGTDFKPAPAGIQFAICTQVIDMGIQPGRGTNGDKRKVYIRFELPEHRVEYTKNGDKVTGPQTVGREFGLSISEKSHLRPFLEGWRGKGFTPDDEKGFDISSIAGKICQLGIVHKQVGDKVYANITSAFGATKEQLAEIKKGSRVAKPEGAVLVYSTDDHDASVFDQLPEWLRTRIDDRVEGDREPSSDDHKGAGQNEDFNDDIPF